MASTAAAEKLEAARMLCANAGLLAALRAVRANIELYNATTPNILSKYLAGLITNVRGRIGRSDLHRHLGSGSNRRRVNKEVNRGWDGATSRHTPLHISHKDDEINQDARPCRSR